MESETRLTTSDAIAKGIIADIQAGFNMTINIGGSVHKVSFFKFVGADKLTYTENSLMFTAKRGKGRLPVRSVITLNEMDTYDIELWTVRKFEAKKIKEVKDIYNDQLADILVKKLEL